MLRRHLSPSPADTEGDLKAIVCFLNDVRGQFERTTIIERSSHLNTSLVMHGDLNCIQVVELT